MDKESVYLLQKIDCNCNDCKFQIRDFETYNKWLEFHKELQYKEYQVKIEKEILKTTSVFQFEKQHLLQYGNCSKFNKNISWIPNTCQLDTQECFKHRKDLD